MPTVSSGALSFSNIRDNFVNYTNFAGFNYGSTNANLYNLNYYRGKRYRKDGNTGTFFSSGAIAFNAFYNSDGNCQCDCDCACDCVCCFPGDAIVKMADGSSKRIDEIKIGDVVSDGRGFKNNVIAYHKIEIGNQPLFTINGKHRTTREHRHWTTEGWAAIDKAAGKTEFTHCITIDNDGTTENRKNVKFTRTPITDLKIGSVLINEQGSKEIIEKITTDWRPNPEMYVYTLVLDGSHSHVVNGYIASGWARDDDFDYTTWTKLRIDNVKDNDSDTIGTRSASVIEPA
jgi:hypothetical protein